MKTTFKIGKIVIDTDVTTNEVRNYLKAESGQELMSTVKDNTPVHLELHDIEFGVEDYTAADIVGVAKEFATTAFQMAMEGHKAEAAEREHQREMRRRENQSRRDRQRNRFSNSSIKFSAKGGNN